MAARSDKNKGQSKKPSASKVQSQSPQRRRSLEDVQAKDGAEGFLDYTTKRDIAGVIFIVLGVVFLLLAVLPAQDAIVSGVASEWVHLLFGVGCYILPVVMFAIGITFLCRFEKERVPARASIGFTIVFIALLGFIALFAPIANLGVDEPDLLFTERSLVNYGGYIGSGIAWCLIELFGKLISGVVLIGIMIVGILIVGFSISRLIEKVRARGREFALQHSASLGGASTSAFARVRKNPPADTPDAARYADELAHVADEPDFDPNHTAVFGMGSPLASSDKAAENAEAAVHGDDRAKTKRKGRSNNPRARLESRIADVDTADASATRRLVPIVHEGTRVPVADNAANADAIHMQMTRPLSKKRNVEDAASGKGDPSKEAPAKGASADKRNRDGFILPDMSLLNSPKRASKGKGAKENLATVADRLADTLRDFGIEADVVDWIAGPTVTLFEVDLPAGVRVSRVTALTDDIALALASPGVRIFAPVPGTNYVGIEVPNASRETVLLSEVLKDAPDGPLNIAIGKDVEGNSIVSDLAKMPHLLIGGTTGSGKSVSINAMIMSILMRATPKEVRFVMIDPKRVEFTPYNGIPHLYVPVVTEPKEAASALAWGVAEMERRLKVFSKVGARNIAQYNAKVREELAKASKDASEPSAKDSDERAEELSEEIPYIVIVIDELADLMMNIGKEVELSISRIAQLARAAGIHLIVATQRPSTNVVTGLIKANITNRIAFNVASGIDSRVILDTAGAESLIGLGDLLLSKPELARPQRIQGCYVSEEEIARVVDFVKAQAAPEYHSEILSTNVYSIGNTNPSGGTSDSRDPLVWEAAEIVVSSNMGSTSNIQRRLKVGYARAGRIMDQLEEMGIVGAANGSKPRDVLVDAIELESIKAFELSDES